MKEFLDWVKATFTVDYQKEIEEYLSDATNHYDLEQRMKRLAQRGMI
jgi:hypothetical protein